MPIWSKPGHDGRVNYAEISGVQGASGEGAGGAREDRGDDRDPALTAPCGDPSDRRGGAEPLRIEPFSVLGPDGMGLELGDDLLGQQVPNGKILETVRNAGSVSKSVSGPAPSNGFMSLTAISDPYSRFIAGWSLHNSLDASWCMDVLQNAIAAYGAPEIINSDQGCQFTCKAWIAPYARYFQMTVSMDGRARAKDNIWIERFWKTVKYDYIYIMPKDNGNAID